MSHFEIVVTLVTIVYGLMLTDLFGSLHKLIRARDSVRWHWLPLLAAWYILLIILKNWWAISYTQDAEHWKNFIIFIGYGHLLVLLYLLVSSVFPDSIPDEGISLKQYYFSNHRYFWGLMCAVYSLAFIISIAGKSLAGDQIHAMSILLKIAFIGLITVLAVSKNYRVHAILLVFFVMEIIAEAVLFVLV
ncbi:MAG: hypothetical protein GXO82_08490 [Chlorobi bacterium]|nr:hypothetical protein [Chlorobiota bacterium]